MFISHRYIRSSQVPWRSTICLFLRLKLDYLFCWIHQTSITLWVTKLAQTEYGKFMLFYKQKRVLWTSALKLKKYKSLIQQSIPIRISFISMMQNIWSRHQEQFFLWAVQELHLSLLLWGLHRHLQNVRLLLTVPHPVKKINSHVFLGKKWY